MRLLRLKDDGEFSLVEYVGRNIPRYAVLSHTWGMDDEEVTFKDLLDGTGKSKAGYRKIRFCGNQATKDGLQYVWVDTCCIDKSSSAELNESINSMFQWYMNAVVCYVSLVDLPPHSSAESGLPRCRWFTRGWTLQELLAPKVVKFFDMDWNHIGTKLDFADIISNSTGIPVELLVGHTALSNASIATRMSWAEIGRAHV